MMRTPDGKQLSFAAAQTLGEVHRAGVVQMDVRRRVVRALRNHGLIARDGGGWSLTDEGLRTVQSDHGTEAGNARTDRNAQVR